MKKPFFKRMADKAKLYTHKYKVKRQPADWALNEIMDIIEQVKNYNIRLGQTRHREIQMSERARIDCLRHCWDAYYKILKQEIVKHSDLDESWNCAKRGNSNVFKSDPLIYMDTNALEVLESHMHDVRLNVRYEE